VEHPRVGEEEPHGWYITDDVEDDEDDDDNDDGVNNKNNNVIKCRFIYDVKGINKVTFTS
jgi:hypothetical protein